MSNIRQKSVLDCQDLIGTARIQISISPTKVATMLSADAKNLFRVEAVFDDFGFFEFLAIELEAGIVGFRKYIDNPVDYSYVSTSEILHRDVVRFVKTLFVEEDVQIEILDQEW